MKSSITLTAGSSAVTAWATVAAASAALVAMTLMATGSLTRQPAVEQAGVAALFAVPVVRNLVVVTLARRRERLLALVGIVLVVVVAVMAFRHAHGALDLDRPSYSLPTSPP
jgi:hypothetical protein